MATIDKALTLEQMIRELAARGELVHLSVSFAPSKTQFGASFGHASGFGISIEHDPDPVEALRAAILSTKVRAPIKADHAIKGDANWNGEPLRDFMRGNDQ